MSPAPTLQSLLADPGRVVGTWSQFADPDMVDVLAWAGMRFSIIDCEHGAFGIETAAALVRACQAVGLPALVRVPRGDHTLAAKAMDYGAAGVVAPGVESAAEAAAWVAALRFAPEGTRGACPIVRTAGHSLTPWAEVLARQAPSVIALIETPPGVDAAEAIAATPGLAAVMVGPFDLSAAFGCAGEVDSAAVQDRCAAVVTAAQGAGLTAWVPVFAADQALLRQRVAFWAARGVRHFPLGADKIIAAAAMRQYLGWAQPAP